MFPRWACPVTTRFNSCTMEQFIFIYFVTWCNIQNRTCALWCNYMKTNFPKLRLRQLDTALERWRSADLPPRPPAGWIRAIRDGLGMSATYLAGRLGVATSTVTRLEQSEADETISLATLRRASRCPRLRTALRPGAQAIARSHPRGTSHDAGPRANGSHQSHHGTGSPGHLPRSA